MAVSTVEMIERQPVMKTVTDIVGRKLLTVFCDTMRNTAKELTPIKTGNNMRSIFMRQVEFLTFEVGTASNYGAYLELGTSRMKARPYMAPAAEAARHKLESLPKGEWS